MLNFILILLISITLAEFFYLYGRFKNLIKIKENFIVSLVHDLKSPLNAEINILNALLKEEYGKMNDEQKEMLKLLLESCEYLTNLIKNVLDGYRCKNFVMKSEKLNLLDLIKTVCKGNEYLAGNKGQKIVLNFSGENFNIYGDKLQIERVIFNLFSNAVTYGLKNSIISVDIGQKNNGIHFSISNKSGKIDKKDLKNLFKQFEVGENSKYNPLSTGLGLYVSKKIINSHHGKIYAKLNKDNIYTVGFYLPCAKKKITSGFTYKN